MKRKLNKQYWGWGLHVDKDGNPHDVFPVAHNEPEPTEKKKSRVERYVLSRPRLKLIQS